VSYLDVRSLCQLGKTSWGLNRLAGDQSVWREACRSSWDELVGLALPPDGESCWKSVYKKFHRRVRDLCYWPGYEPSFDGRRVKGGDYRVVIVGAGGVGKSCLTVRFVQKNYVEKYDPTIEDSYRKVIKLDERQCVLDIMDSAGAEEYSSLRDQYMIFGQGFIVVYSVTSATSFDVASKLLRQIHRMKEDEIQVPIILVGTKADLESERMITYEEGKKLAEKFRCGYVDASSRNNMNVSEAFYSLVRMIDFWKEKNPNKNHDLPSGHHSHLFKKKTNKKGLLSPPFWSSWKKKKSCGNDLKGRINHPIIPTANITVGFPNNRTKKIRFLPNLGKQK